MSGGPAYYNTWYTFQANNGFWLSWSSLTPPYAFLYGDAKDMWFVKNSSGGGVSSGDNSNPLMFTGDLVQIFERISGLDFCLAQTGVGEYTTWSLTTGGVVWQLWNAGQIHDVGQPIDLGQPLVVTSDFFDQQPLTTYPGESAYLTIGSGTPLTFQIQPEGGSDDESAVRTPPKFAKEK